jgi:hypothetical protein
MDSYQGALQIEMLYPIYLDRSQRDASDVPDWQIQAIAIAQPMVKKSLNTLSHHD